MTVLVTIDNETYILNHNVNNYIADIQIRELLGEVNKVENTTASIFETNTVFSNMGVKSEEKENTFEKRVEFLKTLDLSLFSLPSRKEYGYHAKI